MLFHVYFIKGGNRHFELLSGKNIPKTLGNAKISGEASIDDVAVVQN